MISVVVPLYNKAGHIAQALESVLAQSVEASEIIVVDDGSTDHGDMKVAPFTNRGVRLIRQQNQGVSAARNKGLKEASCEYVAFLDADDHWLPNHIEKLSELLRKYPNAALCSTSHYIQRDGQLYAAKSALPVGWTGEVTDFFRTYAHGLSLVNSSTACVKRQALIGSGGFPVGVKRGEDIIAWVGLALSHGVAHLAVPTSVYNQDAENRSIELREQEPPGSLVYLAGLLNSREADQKIMHGVAYLFDRIAVMTAAGFYLSGDLIGAKNIANLAMQAGRWKTTAIIRFVMLMPLGLLRVAKRIRHRRVA